MSSKPSRRCLTCKPWHELLSYETYKRVVIKDPALGVVRYVAILGITLYVVYYRMWLMRGYLKTEDITSALQTTIQAPPDQPENILVFARSAYRYCSEEGVSSAPESLPCRSGPGAWVGAPSSGGKEVFVATRVYDFNNFDEEIRAYVVHPELYTVGFSFSVEAWNLYHQTASSQFALNMDDLTTRLIRFDGTPYVSGVRRENRFDVIAVKDLLSAAGIDSLDDPHDANATQTLRYLGLTLAVNIDCPMSPLGSVTACDYRVRRLAKSEAEAFVVTNPEALFKAKVQERRGIRMIVQMSGTMGNIDSQTIMLELVTCLFLMQIVSWIVEMAMNRLLPFRGIYRLTLYEDSPNMHEYRHGGKKAQRAIARLKADEAARRGEVVAVAQTPKGMATRPGMSRPSRIGMSPQGDGGTPSSGAGSARPRLSDSPIATPLSGSPVGDTVDRLSPLAGDNQQSATPVSDNAAGEKMMLRGNVSDGSSGRV